MEASRTGPLFHGGTDPLKYAAKAQRISNQIGGWLRDALIAPKGVQPNHAWRHRFKTKGHELGIGARILDAIQGHAARTASDNYGDVTIHAKASAIDLFQPYQLPDLSR